MGKDTVGKALEQIQAGITSPQVMSPPVAQHPLRLYVTVTDQSVSGLIAQEVDGEERPEEYRTKEPSLAAYRDEALRLIGTFEEVEAIHVPRAENKKRGTRNNHEGDTPRRVRKTSGRTEFMVGNSEVRILLAKYEGGHHGFCTQVRILSKARQPETCPSTTEHYTRWVEAIATKEAKAEMVTSFIKGNIVCRFGLLKRIVSDNGTHFVNAKVTRILERYRVRHDKFSPYYPQSNDQEESSNKNLIYILGRMVKDAPKKWADYLQLALWAYRTTKHGSTKATPFSLVYGAKEVLLMEILVPSARMMIEQSTPREATAEIIEEVRGKAEDELLKHHRRLTLAYEKLVRPRMFCEEELVLKATDAMMRKHHTSKWAPNWEGPYIVKEARDNGCCTLVDPEDQREIGPINFKDYSSQEVSELIMPMNKDLDE
ncbi:Ribonuclease H-like superfamily [Sesbania bispinosa]|nr:Ribonuclease H-like superfamily [Sesbania bispinosa]